MTKAGLFAPADIEQFKRHGYAIVRGLASPDAVARMRAVALRHLTEVVPPVEYEADLGYPGAPASRDVSGGLTVRRLLQAYARDPVFAEWATSAPVAQRLRQLLGPDIVLSQAHHNCVMTKHPRYSSLTGWHRDVRYWAFERPELVSVWLALGEERRDNGCLLLLPGTHAVDVDAEQLDAAQFLRSDVPANQSMIESAVTAELQPGDVLFFHCRVFHAAGANQTDEIKFSPVFTYHTPDNHPLPGTRSASRPGISITAA